MTQDTSAHLVESEESSDLNDSKYQDHVIEAPNRRFDSDNDLDDQEDNEGRDTPVDSDSLDDLGVQQETDIEQEESYTVTREIDETTVRAFHDPAGTHEGIAASTADGHSDLREAGHITISDDLSHSSQREERQFLALHERPTRDTLQPGPPRRETPQPQSVGRVHTLSTYQEQLTFLAYENRGRPLNTLESHVDEPTSKMGEPGSVDATRSSSKRRLSHFDSGTELEAQVMNLDLIELQHYISRLAKRATYLKSSSYSMSQPTHRHVVLYRIQGYRNVSDSRRKNPNSSDASLSAPFLDAPEWIGPVDTGTLHSKVPIQNFDLYLEKNKDISFIVFKTYIAQHSAPVLAAPQTDDIIEITINESIKPVTKELVEAVRHLLGSQDEYSDLLHDFEAGSELSAPYLFVFHQRGYPNTLPTTTKDASQEQVTQLWDYVIKEHGDEYTTADTLISAGRINSDSAQYLFKPGETLIQRKTGFYLGWVAKSWARHINTYQTTRERARAMSLESSHIPIYGKENASKEMDNERVWVQNWAIPVWHWDFDGNFQRRDTILSFPIVTKDRPGAGPGTRHASKVKVEEAASAPDSIPINELGVFPIQFASPDIVQQLRRRGQAFWKCRNRKLVSYEERARDSQESMLEERYMVDLKTYRALHKSNQYEMPGSSSGLLDELGPEAMAKEEPPDEKFELLLPPTIKGFNMRRKKWFDLDAERITDVEWNEDAFRKVVMNSKAKDLIQALVSDQLASEASTDLIANKGNGLILLLHGSPGTGKTLTAEGVAEITKKPLYRVTCADIGTKPEEAEKYLESILHLGKLWKCVVLLDEADVFLEQRSLEDLKRNSLVSVFLRILEYYEGILILTSNRVGTFDEAFKSRIQLALHYPALGSYERLRIWENFLERLEKLKDASIDIPDLRNHLKDLQDEKMNGREIRNVITTARQYAKWKDVTLTYKYLKEVIDVAGLFDQYLDKLHGGRSQDQLAKEDELEFMGWQGGPEKALSRDADRRPP